MALQDTLTSITVTDAENTALALLLENLGFLLYGSEFAGPLWPFLALGDAIATIAEIFLGGGRPKAQDTQNVIDAYKRSAYWPLHALASDLEIALKNGAPISDSNPAIQAQFSAWKRGTITSIQQLAGIQQGPAGAGYWQLQQLINLSWDYSKYGVDSVLHVVKAIDQMTIGLSLLAQQNKTQPPPGGGGGGGGDGSGGGGGSTLPPCDNAGNPDSDEVLDNCAAVSSRLDAIIAELKALPVPQPPPSNQHCCTNITDALVNLNELVLGIWQTIQRAGNGGGGPSVDLTPIVGALANLTKELATLTPVVAAEQKCICDGLAKIAEAMATSPGTDVSGIVKALNQANTMMDVPQPIIDSLATLGLVSAQDAQLAGGGPWAYINTLLHDEWRKLNHPPSPEEVAALKADPVFGPGATAVLTGKPLPAFKEVFKVTPSVIGEVAGKALQAVMEAGFIPGEQVLQPIIKTILGVHEKAIAGLTNIKPGDEVTAASELLSEAGLFGVAAHWAAILGECLYPTKHVGLTEVAALLAEVAGFGEITGGIIGPEMKAKIAIPHQYFINNQARSLLPGHAEAAVLAARGLIDHATAEQLLAYNNLSGDYTAPVLQSAYHGMSARILLRLIEFGIFTEAEIHDELTFDGMRPLSQQRMIKAAAYMAADPYRKQAQAALEKQYVAGLLDDQAFIQAVDSTRNTDNIDNLILMRVQLEKHTALTKELEVAYTDLAVGGVIDEPTFASDLNGLGLQPDAVNARLAIVDARLKAAGRREMLAAERALERQTLAIERKTALQNFRSGVIDSVGLAAALAATGLTVVEIAAWVDFANLQKKGTARYIYGLAKTPAEAALLRDRVTALTDQRKKQFLTDAQYLAELQALGIPPDYQNALLAQAAALTTPKSAATLIQVQT